MYPSGPSGPAGPASKTLRPSRATPGEPLPETPPGGRRSGSRPEASAHGDTGGRHRWPTPIASPGVSTGEPAGRLGLSITTEEGLLKDLLRELLALQTSSQLMLVPEVPRNE